MNIVVVDFYIPHRKISARCCIVACRICLCHDSRETSRRRFNVINFKISCERFESSVDMTALNFDSVKASGLTARYTKELAVSKLEAVAHTGCIEHRCATTILNNHGCARSADNILKVQVLIGIGSA